jgi:hypothetical protein
MGLPSPALRDCDMRCLTRHGRGGAGCRTRSGMEPATNKGRRWAGRAAICREALAARTAGLVCAVALDKWPLGDIAFGINHDNMRVQVIMAVQARVGSCSDCRAVSAY